MAAAVVEVIGIVSGLLGIVQFGIDNFAEEPGDGTTYKVAVGLDGTGNGLSNAGGNLPDVRVFNGNGQFVGIEVDSGNVDDGNLGEIHVDHENQGVYTLFSANDDAICVAWVTAAWSANRGGGSYAVQGDMGYFCGAPWYYSGMYYNSNEDQGRKPPEEQAKCFWIDKNGDKPNTGFQVRWPAFSQSEKRNPKLKCDGISFGLRTRPDPSSIFYWTDKKTRSLASKGLSVAREREDGLAGQTKTHNYRRNAAMASALIVGDADGHSARFLCESESSVGPDLANTREGLFCDMDEKKLYQFCGGDLQSGCFDLDSKTLKPPGNGDAAISTVQSDAVGKSYDSTLDWRIVSKL